MCQYGVIVVAPLLDTDIHRPSIVIEIAQYSVFNAQCSMLSAQCSMLRVQCSIKAQIVRKHFN